ncbi:MAG: diadenosine tetraphosphatase [Ignavibacteriae bacterium HGW-Ignavibacteriae-3]|nr:MAG: diadenosine tetraphosphatase [Ignavibacteriae bacterium HGW-Ignavibacteriae-3]
MVAVIGDIHGCYFTLAELYHKITFAYPNIPVYTVGDMVDRGNNSCEVFKFIIENNIQFTPGNHDYMFYHFFKDPQSVFARSWFFNGNESTLESYESREMEMFEHIDLIKSAPLYYNLSDCFISHAGISVQYEKYLPKDFRENLDLLDSFIMNDLRSDRGILWARDPLLNLGKLQVVGHTTKHEITLVEDSNAVYIDTGVFLGNKLSAVIIHESAIVETIEVKAHMEDIIKY